MKVLVLGSGVIGTSVAYYLARAGHEVEVVDRQAGPALETSFANAGEVSPGYSAPWAGPGVPVKAIKWMLMQHSPLVIWPLLDPRMWRWGAMMLANCTGRAYAVNKSRMVPIAEYSRDCLRSLRAETGIAYDERTQGTLQLFRTQKQLDGIGGDVEVLRQYGVPFEVLDRDGFCRVEPAWCIRARSSSVRCGCPVTRPATASSSRTGWPTWLADWACSFRFDTHASRASSGKVAASPGCARALAACRPIASSSRWAATRRTSCAPVGIRHAGLPRQGLLDHRADHRRGSLAESTIMDETHKVAVTRLGDRIRVGGTAELAGYSLACAKPGAPRSSMW
jgi:D-amino-acid dehydrogenase